MGLIGRIASLFSGDSQGSLEVLWESSFKNDDPQGPGEGLKAMDRCAVLADGALRLRNGCLVLGQTTTSDCRLETEMETPAGTPLNFGMFIGGSEAFWNGYSAQLSPGRAEIRKFGVVMAVAEGVALVSGRRMRLAFQKRHQKLGLFLDGVLILEALDLDPLPEEGQDKAGLYSWASEPNFHRLRLARFSRGEKLSPLSVGDRLMRRRKPEAAIQQYQAALEVLDGEEKEIARLRVALCQAKTGRFQDALSSLGLLELENPSAAARRMILSLHFRCSIPAQNWDLHWKSLQSMEGQRENFAARASALAVLGRWDETWAHRRLWAGGRASEVAGLLRTCEETWASLPSALSYLRFLKIAQGLKEFLDELSSLAAAPESLSILPAVALGLGELQAEAQAWGSWLTGLKPAYVRKDEPPNLMAPPSLPELIDLYGVNGGGLVEKLREEGEPSAHVNYGFRARFFGDYALARGNPDLAREIYAFAARRYAGNGSAASSCLLGLALIELWRGNSAAAAAAASRILADFKADPWAHPLARLLSRRYSAQEFALDQERDLLWAQSVPQGVALMAPAALAKFEGRKEDALAHLEMVEGIHFPWESASGAAGFLARDLGRGA